MSSKKDASPSKKKSASSSAAAAGTGASSSSKVVISADVEEEVKRLLKDGVWKEMKQESTGKTYYYNKATKATCWDLKKEIAKQKAASAPSAAGASPLANANPMAAAANPMAAAAAASPTDAEPSSSAEEPASGSAKKVVKKVGGKASKASSKASSDDGAEQRKEVEAERAAAQEAREQQLREEAARSTAEAVAAAVGEVKAAAALERQQLENKEMKLREQEMNLEQQRNVKLRDLLKYTDPLDRLVQENSLLQQMVVTGNSGHVALDFQAKYEAVVRTNNALTVQMGRMKQEYDAMQRALTDANFKIHQQQMLLQERQAPSGRTRDEELQATMGHLRDQNRELVQQVCELSLLLSRGLNEIAYRTGSQMTDRGGAGGVGGDGGSADDGDEFLSTALSKVLDSHARSVLCSSCTAALSKVRDQTVPRAQSTLTGRNAGGGYGGADSSGIGGIGGGGGSSSLGAYGYSGAAHYIGVNESPLSHSTGSQHPNNSSSGFFTQQQQQQQQFPGSVMSSTANAASRTLGGGGGQSTYPGGGGGGSYFGSPSATVKGSVGSLASSQGRGGGAGSAGIASSVTAALGPSGGGNTPIMYGGFMVRNPKANF